MKANTATTRILSALLLGLALGILFADGRVAWLESAIAVAEPIGALWLNGLRMTIVPLVFALLVTGIAANASAASAGGLAVRALAVFSVLLLLAGLFGEVASKLFLALWPIPAEAAVALRSAISAGAEVPPGAPLSQWLAALVPANPIKAAAQGEMLPLVLFALLFGFALIRIPPARGRLLVDFFQAVVDTMLVLVRWVILVAPAGVFALAFVVGARAGVGAANALGHYLVLLVAVQALLILLAYPAVRLWAGVGMREFARAVAPAQAVATSTQSSLASLPAMLEAAQALRLPPRVSAMVLPMAVSVFRITSPAANLAVVAYCAALFGVEPTLAQYLAGAALAVAMSLAAVGLPGQITFFASIVPICAAMGVPVAALPLLLAVETIPDIFRTIGNVTADGGVAAGLARTRAARALESTGPVDGPAQAAAVP
jgi:Na+/H+-dicarboxylate symporter